MKTKYLLYFPKLRFEYKYIYSLVVDLRSRSLNEEQDPEAKANFQRRIQQMLTKQRELCLNEAKINRVKILSSFGSGPTKSHYDSSVPGHTRLKSGFLDSLAECALLISFMHSLFALCIKCAIFEALRTLIY